MWICSKLGFFSIVQKDDGYFHVRARVKGDLENLCKMAGIKPATIETWPNADYRFRVLVGNRNICNIFGALEHSIDYPNFKSEISSNPAQSPKLPAYHQLWHNLAKLQN